MQMLGDMVGDLSVTAHFHNRHPPRFVGKGCHFLRGPPRPHRLLLGDHGPMGIGIICRTDGDCDDIPVGRKIDYIYGLRVAAHSKPLLTLIDNKGPDGLSTPKFLTAYGFWASRPTKQRKK